MCASNNGKNNDKSKREHASKGKRESTRKAKGTASATTNLRQCQRPDRHQPRDNDPDANAHRNIDHRTTQPANPRTPAITITPARTRAQQAQPQQQNTNTDTPTSTVWGWNI
eukprot:5384645-Alexandrium_andersonii.AAC.1